MGELGEEARGLHVTTIRKQVITASLPLQDHWLPLSNLDLLLPPLDVNVCFSYKKPLTITNSVAFETLKMALAETLVSYYAFSGEIVTNPTGEPEIFCNNRGVDYLEAEVDVDLRDVNFHDPDESIAKLAPTKKNGVLAIQVTQLRCGSIVVGCTFDHRVSDAYSMNMFLISWAEISRSDVPISCVPSFRRSLLNTRRPLILDSSIDQMYFPVTSLPPPQETTDPDDIIVPRVYYMKADSIEELQTLASTSKNGQRTKLESFSAFLWKLVAEHAAKDPVSDKKSKLGIVVDGRTRFMKEENSNYFGNVLSIPFGGQRIDDLINKPLPLIAEDIHKILEKSVNKEHFLNLIDWVETRRPTPSVSGIYCNGAEEGPAFVVSSGRSFPVKEVDFGWGSPVFGSYHFPWGGNTGYVMPMPSSVNEGDWIVYLNLTKGQLKFIEAQASHFIKPIDNDYLDI